MLGILDGRVGKILDCSDCTAHSVFIRKGKWMHKRYLDCNASELLAISKPDLLDALRASEGRIVVSETIGAVQPLLLTVTNAELAASQGADLLLLNMFDVDHPVIHGMPDGIEPDQLIRALQRLTG